MKNNLKDFWRGFTNNYVDVDWEEIGNGIHFVLALTLLGCIPITMIFLLAKLFN